MQRNNEAHDSVQRHIFGNKNFYGTAYIRVSMCFYRRPCPPYVFSYLPRFTQLIILPYAVIKAQKVQKLVFALHNGGSTVTGLVILTSSLSFFEELGNFIVLKYLLILSDISSKSM